MGINHAGVRVRTDTGWIVMVFPWTSGDRSVFHPLRLGYASTLMKLQGATIGHLTIWFGVPNIEAAAYVALSRVRKDRDWQFVGNPGVHHFTPSSAAWQ